MEVITCYTYQRTKGQKYSKLPAKVAEEIPWNELLPDIIDHVDLKIPINVIRKREKK